MFVLKTRETFWSYAQPWSIITSGALVTMIIPGLKSCAYSGGKRKIVIINRNTKNRGGVVKGWYIDYTDGFNSLCLFMFAHALQCNGTL